MAKGEKMLYLIYCDDPKITNFYIYDSSKHVIEGTNKVHRKQVGDETIFSSYHQGKNKLSRSNGCLTSLNKNETNLTDIINFYKEIRLPACKKYIIAVNNKNKLCGLKVSFKKSQQFDKSTGQVIYSGEQSMQITCQDENWLSQFAPASQIMDSIKEKGFYCEQYNKVNKDEITFPSNNNEIKF